MRCLLTAQVYYHMRQEMSRSFAEKMRPPQNLGAAAADVLFVQIAVVAADAQDERFQLGRQLVGL